jgi:hypothetical protein
MATPAEKRAAAQAALAAMPTYAERLVKVRAAIDALLETGQGVSYEGRSLQMADLESLRKLEEIYLAKALVEASECPPGRNRIFYVAPVG